MEASAMTIRLLWNTQATSENWFQLYWFSTVIFGSTLRLTLVLVVKELKAELLTWEWLEFNISIRTWFLILNVRGHRVQEEDSQPCLTRRECNIDGEKNTEEKQNESNEERKQCSNITAVKRSGFTTSLQYVCVEINCNTVYYRLPNEGCVLKKVGISRTSSPPCICTCWWVFKGFPKKKMHPTRWKKSQHISCKVTLLVFLFSISPQCVHTSGCLLRCVSLFVCVPLRPHKKC